LPSLAARASVAGWYQRGGLVSRRWRTTKIVQYGDVSQKRIAQPTTIHGNSFANYWLGPI
jgi:hypothetical protein